MKYIIIPARGGSKGIPNKNLKRVSGISLVGWSVIHGKYISGKGDQVIVSSDSSEILDEASKFGAQTLIRPEELSGDAVFTEPVMDHALSKYALNNDDIIVLLQPTSPLRYKSTLNRCIQSIKNNGFDSSLTVKKIHLFRWKKVHNSFIPLYTDRPRRQDMEDEFCETGSIYVTTYAQYKSTGLRLSGKTEGVVTEDEESIDVDTSIDLDVVRLLSHTFLEEWRSEIRDLGIQI